MGVCIWYDRKDPISVFHFASMAFPLTHTHTGGYWQNSRCTSLNSKLTHPRRSGNITSHLCTSCFFFFDRSALLPRSQLFKQTCFLFSFILTRELLWGLRCISCWIILKKSSGGLFSFGLICCAASAELCGQDSSCVMKNSNLCFLSFYYCAMKNKLF